MKEKSRCRIEGCNNYTSAKGLCHSHYWQVRYKGLDENGNVNPYSINTTTKCKEDGCSDIAVIKGYCRYHNRVNSILFERLARKSVKPRKDNTTTVNLIHRKEDCIVDGKPVCSIEGCNYKRYARGYCAEHYHHLRNIGVLKNLEIPKTCKEVGCEKRHYAKGYCNKHYLNSRKPVVNLNKNVDSNTLEN